MLVFALFMIFLTQRRLAYATATASFYSRVHGLLCTLLSSMGFSGQQLLWNYYGWSAACAHRLNFLSAAGTGGFCRCPHLQPLDDHQKTVRLGLGVWGLGFQV